MAPIEYYMYGVRNDSYINTYLPFPVSFCLIEKGTLMECHLPMNIVHMV